MSTERLSLAEYTLEIDTTTGGLAYLVRHDGPNALQQGHQWNTANVSLAWQVIRQPQRYVSHIASSTSLTISIDLAPLVLHDQYRVADGLIERWVTVENPSDQEVQLTGVRLALPNVALGNPRVCRFEAPGNTVRPRLPLAAAARQTPTPIHAKPGIDHPPPGPDFAPGASLRYNRALEDAPDAGLGLLIVYNPDITWSLLTWYMSEWEVATPWVSGDGIYATLGFDLRLAGWLAPGHKLDGGTQYILLHEGDYASALETYQSYYTHSGITPPLYGQPDKALDITGLYEAHPGQFGGFNGLQTALSDIKQLAVDTLYLLPVMSHRNKKNLPWDGNWEEIGSPYAIHDFEQFEPSLGDADDFDDLVDTAHDIGIRVLMDLVLQGCSLESRYVTEHPEWFVRDEQGQMIHSHGWNDTWSFDWANADYQKYRLELALHFARRYKIDGYRVDALIGKEPNWDRNLAYHAGCTNLGVRTLVEELRQELLTMDPDAILFSELSGPLWTHSHDISSDYNPYAMALQLFEQQLTPYEFNEYLRDYWTVMPPASPRICFTETHDTRSGLAHALRGSAFSKALLGILVMAGFVPMIWARQERGQEDFIRGLMLARRENNVLRRGMRLFNEVLIDDEDHYRHTRGDAPQDHVYTIVRYSDQAVLFGLASLFPERVTYRFGLPLEKLPLDPKETYQLRNLVTYKLWDEYGQQTWAGAELASFHLTPHMYTPYIFRIEPAD